MLKLGGKVVTTGTLFTRDHQLYSVTTNANLPLVVKNEKAYLITNSLVPEGFAHYLVLNSKKEHINASSLDAACTVLPDEYDYLGEGDVIRLSPEKGLIRVLYRASSPHNSFLVTEQCDHYCLMCSQPPKAIDDLWLLDQIKRAIPLIPKSAQEITFTGGEPTLHGNSFLDILKLTKNYLPNTSIHILSNGRRFSDLEFTRDYSAINHHDMMVGIPIYSDVSSIHDYIVQSKGAFDETLRGVLNLKKNKQKVEIRIVIHKLSIERLRQLAEFIARNLLFVDHVALMGLEMTGFTRANLDKLWIDPIEYKDLLSETVNILVSYGINVSVYNHQLCLVNRDIEPYYRKSISDWKNEYPPECDGCKRQYECGGFFTSGIKNGYSRHLSPFV